MKKYYAVLILFSLAFLALGKPSSAKAATAGPVDVQQLTAQKGANSGQVTLWWKQSSSETSAYHIVYGTSPLNYQYSALNIRAAGVGVQTSFTVSLLNPGQTYYFALVPIKNGSPTKPTMEVAMQATTGASTQTTTSVPSTAVTAGPKGVTQLTAKAGNNRGEVVLTWTQYNSATSNYHVSYGTESRKYMYGALNVGTAGIGKINTFTVKALVSGQRYFFALTPVQNGQAIGWTKEVSFVAP